MQHISWVDFNWLVWFILQVGFHDFEILLTSLLLNPTNHCITINKCFIIRYIYLFIYLFICLFIYLFIHLFIYYLFIYSFFNVDNYRTNTVCNKKNRNKVSIDVNTLLKKPIERNTFYKKIKKIVLRKFSYLILQ